LRLRQRDGQGESTDRGVHPDQLISAGGRNRPAWLDGPPRSCGAGQSESEPRLLDPIERHLVFLPGRRDAAQPFNLSLYTTSADFSRNTNSPLAYNETTGRDLTFTVTDKNGPQTFHVFNNAPGVWVTFPVQGDPGVPIVVQVAATGPTNTSACISAVAFDPPDSPITSGVSIRGHLTTMTYTPAGDLATITDPLGMSPR